MQAENFKSIVGLGKLRCQHRTNPQISSPRRSDRTALPPSGSTFAREIADPLTPAREPQCNVGTDAQRIMGKEVKEEQNRLKGGVVSGFRLSFYYGGKPQCGPQLGLNVNAAWQKMSSASLSPTNFCGCTMWDALTDRHLKQNFPQVQYF